MLLETDSESTRAMGDDMSDLPETGIDPGSKRAELRMKAISEATWMNAANKGLSRPAEASAMPVKSTTTVPMKLAQMMIQLGCRLTTLC